MRSPRHSNSGVTIACLTRQRVICFLLKTSGRGAKCTVIEDVVDLNASDGNIGPSVLWAT